MLVRALFWISVVAVLMPHEPDLGLGRPKSVGTLIASTSTPADLGCQDNAKACGAALRVIDSFQAVAVRNLAEVKADIERAERDHKAAAAD